MYRRAVLGATVGCLCCAGCLSNSGSVPSTGTDGPPTDEPTATASRTRTGVEASFEVVDGHQPTDPTAAARFEADRVIVTGTMDPGGCREPILGSVAYDRPAGRLRLVVDTESPYGPTATVECGNASYDYRCTVSVEDGTPAVVEVVHAHEGRDDRTFVLRDE